MNPVIFLTLWTSVFLWTVYQLNDDSSSRAAGRAPLAEVKNLAGDVFVKASYGLAWSQLKPGDTLYVDDLVSTDKNGKALLKFLDGTSLLLKPESQIELQSPELGEKRTTVSFIRGEAVAKASRVSSRKKKSTTPETVITTDRLKFDMTKSSGSISLSSKNKSMLSEVKKMSGDIKIDVQDDQSQRLALLVGDRGKQIEVKTVSFSDLDKILDIVRIEPTEKIQEAPPKPDPQQLAALRARDFSKDNLPIFDHPDGYLVPSFQTSDLDQFIIEGVRYQKPKDLRVSYFWEMGLDSRFADSNASVLGSLQDHQLSIPWRVLYERFLRQLKPDAQSLTLHLRAGFRNTADQGKSFFSKTNQVKFLSIDRLRNDQLVAVDRLSFDRKNSDFISLKSTIRELYKIKFFRPVDMRKVHQYLLPSSGVKIVQSRLNADQFANIILAGHNILGFIQGEKLKEGEARKILGSFNADLIYFGRPLSFLNKNTGSDFQRLLTSNETIFFVHRSKLVDLDKELMRTHDEAKRFIDKFNPYFFKEKVEILSADPNRIKKK